MTDVNYASIQLHLKKEFERLSAQLQDMRRDNLSEEARDGSTFGPIEEEAAESANLENLLAQEERIVYELADIDASLKKFMAGTYGICEKCGRHISLARLRAVPTARYCINDSQDTRLLTASARR
jgi:DnaK suppressor protein